jgi:hypothetical protein
LDKILTLGATIKQQLIQALDKATPAFLWQLFQFVQPLKKAEMKNAKQQGEHPLARFIGCLSMEEGNAFAADLEREFSQIEGEW